MRAPVTPSRRQAADVPLGAVVVRRHLRVVQESEQLVAVLPNKSWTRSRVLPREMRGSAVEQSYPLLRDFCTESSDLGWLGSPEDPSRLRRAAYQLPTAFLIAHSRVD
jgi:hypothetical protein